MSKEMIEEIAKDFFQLMPMLRKNVIKPFEKISDAISPLQFHILLILKDKKPRSMSDLATEMDVLKQQLTFLTDKLAENNYIQRIPDPKDRRSIKVSITQSGLDYLDKYREQTLNLITLKFEQLSIEELDELHTAIQSMHKIINRL